ncbi:MAG: 30S ribosomal protein S17 [Promethearchaeota archaeon]
MVANDIGLKVKPPDRECQDPRCPFHGTLPVRGRVLTGKVAGTRMKGTITIRREYLRFVNKYRRYARCHSMMSAHLPPCIEVEEGDVVRIAECRPLSKTVSFVVVERTKSMEEKESV